ncbi:hypothetical protein [Bradyrhizobium neotropicale]|uniref:hypothetical protein n=1 Tax=Bradyrhizobium neotropicale TaxID=1497615 RepID=UPI001AD6B4F8|nr:hypothetical protein [Bradyrhizobium neotropicale]MBO4228034.1 hypothetical protein [Bradyrhizobium neotropicale]
MESYKHVFAKRLLARWLADPQQDLFPSFHNASGGGPFGGGVFFEYPICEDGNGKWHGHDAPWNEICPEQFGDSCSDHDNGAWNCEWKTHPPSYDRCLELGLTPLVIFDVLAHHEGIPYIAVEVEHRNRISKKKTARLESILQHTSIELFVIDADWVLSQVRRPKKLKTLWTWR